MNNIKFSAVCGLTLVSRNTGTQRSAPVPLQRADEVLNKKCVQHEIRPLMKNKVANNIQLSKEELNVRGSYVQADAVWLDNKVVVAWGKLFKTAWILEDLYADVNDPELLIKGMEEAGLKADIFTFFERFPEAKPKFDYYMEWDAYSILPVTTYDDWYQNQIRKTTRHAIRTAEKRGVVTRITEFNDDLVKGVMNIYNETPTRQGKPFWHYEKEFEVLKEDLSRDLDRCDFIGAYHDDALIGFVKLLYADNVADPVLCISMMEHYDKRPNNALLAEVVKIAEGKNLPYIHYGSWRRGSHAKFLASNGFQKVLCPRYFIPLTVKGKIVLKLRLHKDLNRVLQGNIKTKLMDVRESILMLRSRNQSSPRL